MRGGRILNPKTARSQVIGAMTMGAGAALMEELAVDRPFGFFVNHDLAGYEVPVHTDIPHQEVIFLDETDPISSPMKAKGVGELGICGVAAAMANAVYNATGVRVRDYPITLDKLLDGLPEAYWSHHADALPSGDHQAIDLLGGEVLPGAPLGIGTGINSVTASADYAVVSQGQFLSSTPTTTSASSAAAGSGPWWCRTATSAPRTNRLAEADWSAPLGVDRMSELV